MSGHFQAEHDSPHREGHPEYDGEAPGIGYVPSHDQGNAVDMEEGMVEEPNTKHKVEIDELNHEIQALLAITRLDENEAILLKIHLEKKRQERSSIDVGDREAGEKATAEISVMNMKRLALEQKTSRDSRTISELQAKIHEIIGIKTDSPSYQSHSRTSSRRSPVRGSVAMVRRARNSPLSAHLC